MSKRGVSSVYDNSKFMEDSIIDKEVNLFDAIKKGDLERVNDLIAQGVDVNSITQLGCTPLYFAMYAAAFGSGKIDIVKALIENNANIEEKAKVEDNTHTPLRCAALIASKNEVVAKEIFNLLLDAGADPDDHDEDQINLIEILEFNNASRELVKYLKNKIGDSKENLKKLAEHFEEILKAETARANKLGKKLLIIIAEWHNIFKIYQKEKRFLSISKKRGINTLFFEFTTKLAEQCEYKIRLFAKNHLQFSIVDVDDHPLLEKATTIQERMRVASNEEATVQERNIVMANRLNEEKESGVLIIGKGHLLGLLADPTSKIDRNIYHVVPINLQGHPSEMLELSGSIFNDPNYVIQVLDDFSFSKTDDVIAYWNSNDSDNFLDKTKLEEFDKFTLKKDPNFVLSYALDKKLLDLIPLAINMGADVCSELQSRGLTNDLQAIKLLLQAIKNVNSHDAVIKDNAETEDLKKKCSTKYTPTFDKLLTQEVANLDEHKSNEAIPLYFSLDM